MHAHALEEALAVLRKGGIVAMPTDTVYGLHCDPHCLPAVEKIIQLKKRSMTKGLILVGDCLERFAEFIQPLPADIALKIKQHPGITWLVPAQETISPLIRGEFKTLAIRLCANDFIKELSAQLNSPLISTSANISEQPVAQTAAEIKAAFHDGIDLILAGNIPPNAVPSEIRDAFTDAKLR